MQVICKECGKVFELSQGEMDFFRSKNLNFPKRCKACRNAARSTVEEVKSYSPKSINHKATTPQSGVKLICIAAGAVIAVALAVILFRLAYSPTQAIDALNETNTTSSIDNYEYYISEPEEYAVPFSSSQSDSHPEYSSSPMVTYALQFRYDDYLQEHFDKHGRGMGYATAQEYLQRANDIVVHTDVLTKLQQEDDDTAYFLEATGEFVVVSQDGYIRTFFIPEDGIEYFNRQ